MTDRTLRKKVEQLQQINQQISTMEAQVESLKAQIKAEMQQRDTDELQAGDTVVRWKSVSSSRFDTKAFQQAHSRLYERFAVPATTRRFTLVSV